VIVTSNIKTVVHIRPVSWFACRSATPLNNILGRIFEAFIQKSKSNFLLALSQESLNQPNLEPIDLAELTLRMRKPVQAIKILKN
jgi:hypothetical protein